jgi:hypothetical protein
MTGPWFCDTCGKLIKKPEDGMLQWLVKRVDDRAAGRDLRIVHHLAASPLGGKHGCYANVDVEFQRDGSILADWHLTEALGPDGLVRLLTLIEDKQLAISQVNRVIMRLFVPSYEQTRQYFEQAVAEGVIDPGLPEGYFLQSQLSEIIKNIPRLRGMS